MKSARLPAYSIPTLKLCRVISNWPSSDSTEVFHVQGPLICVGVAESFPVDRMSFSEASKAAPLFLLSQLGRDSICYKWRTMVCVCICMYVCVRVCVYVHKVCEDMSFGCDYVKYVCWITIRVRERALILTGTVKNDRLQYMTDSKWSYLLEFT